MDLSPLKNLSPEEREALRAALAEPEQEDPMAQVMSALKFCSEEISSLSEKIASVCEQHENLKKLVMEELIGGLAEAYNANKEAEEFEGFKGKFGSMFEPFGEKFKSTYGVDLLPKVHSHWKEMSSEDGFSEEIGKAELEKLVNEIKEKLGFVEDQLKAQGEASEEPPEEDAQAAWNEVERMKRRDDARDAQKKGA